MINGNNIPAALRGSITSINYTNGIEGADRVEIGLANPDLHWLDHPLLQMDNSLALSIGYAPGPLEEVFVGEITGMNASFPGGGIPTLTVAAHDFLQRLTTGSKERSFKIGVPCIGDFPIPDPLVSVLVSAGNGLLPAIDPIGGALSFLTFLISYLVDPLEAKKAMRVQKGQSDYDFLSMISKENGWEMYIDHSQEPRGRVLKFKFMASDLTPEVSLQWGHSLMDFTPRITNVGQIAGVSTCVWIPSVKLEFTIVLAWDYDRAAFDLKVFPGDNNLELLLGSATAQQTLNITAASLANAPKQILSELLPRLNNRLTGSGSTIGNPNIKAGKVINLEGLGDQFSGLYRVTMANHSFDSGGYRTSFEVRKEVWFGSVPVPKGTDGLARLQV